MLFLSAAKAILSILSALDFWLVTLVVVVFNRSATCAVLSPSK